MEKQPIDDSQLEISEKNFQGKKFPQYLIAFFATIGGLAAGTILGWSSPAAPRLRDGEYGFEVTENNEAWIISIAMLGAATACFPTGFTMKKIGRKPSMIIMVVPFTLGWLLIILASNVGMLMAGRFFVGIGAGAACIIIPVYNSEISQDDVRGPIGTMFQIMYNTGIIMVYAVGGYTKVYILSIVCGVFPLIFVLIVCFMPESPYYLLTVNKTDEARRNMVILRGEEYDSSVELEIMQANIDEERRSKTSFVKSFSNRPAIVSVIICVGAMVFVELSGSAAVLLNAATIFESSGAKLSPNISSIIIGVIQLIATFVSTLTINRLGRKPLLLIAATTMAICDTLLGVYFYLNEFNPESANSIRWLPLVSLCVFMIALSIGHGPIVWMLPGEVCALNIRPIVTSLSVLVDWLSVFIVSRTFRDMQNSLGDYGTFWFYALITYIGIPFVYFVIPETKGKSIDEVQELLKGKKAT